MAQESRFLLQSQPFHMAWVTGSQVCRLMIDGSIEPQQYSNFLILRDSSLLELGTEEHDPLKRLHRVVVQNRMRNPAEESKRADAPAKGGFGHFLRSGAKKPDD